MRYIYITTNNVNGKRYLGQRKIPLNKTVETDNYLGSGNLLLKAIKKHGKENFSKEIIHLCNTQKEADFLEIFEIRERKILENPDLWYNRDAVGQYGRCEKHSELTSKAMKTFYSTDKGYTETQIKINRHKYLKGEKTNNVIFLAFKDINKLRNELIKQNNNRNKVEKKKIIELIRNSNRISKSDAARKAYDCMVRKHLDIKEKRAMGRRKSFNEAKEKGINLYSDNTLKKFALAKCKASNNKIGEYIINNYNINYRLISPKVKKTITTKYKDINNLYMQVDKIIAIISDKTNESIDRDVFIELIAETRRLRGVID